MTIDTEYIDPAEYFATSDPEALRRVKIVTVHGTNAGAVSSSGDGWWQWGSEFQQELGERIDIDVNPEAGEVRPLHWDIGPNSEEHRRLAGKKLFYCMSMLEEAGADYYVVGHSHGGSVVYNALLESVNTGYSLERLKGWCTVGTPFLDYRPNRFLFQRLENLPLAFFATGLVAFFVGLFISIYVWLKEAVEFEAELQNLGFIFMLYGVSAYLGMFIYERFHKSWFTLKQKQKAAELYADRWLGLWHPEDEAISALDNIRRIKFQLIKKDFLKPLVGLVQLGFVGMIGVVALLDVVFNGASGLSELFLFPQLTVESSVVGAVADPAVEEDPPAEAMFLVLLLFFFVFLWLLSWLLRKTIVPIGRILAWPLNKITWGSLRRGAWGDNLVKEDVRDVSHAPPAFPGENDSLPDFVAEPLRKFSDANAIKSLENVRKILGMSRDSSPNSALGTDLESTLNWKELIHTSYFHVPEFIDLMALGLHSAGMGELKEGFVLTPEREQLAEWSKNG